MNKNFNYFDQNDNFHDSGFNKKYILVPSTKLKFVEVDVPGTGNLLLRAIPFALEDEIANDINDNFYCLLGKNKENKNIVAIIEHRQMQIWLQKIKSTSYASANFIPDALFIPYPKETEAGVTLGIINGCIVIRKGHFDITSIRQDIPSKLIEQEITKAETMQLHDFDGIDKDNFINGIFKEHIVTQFQFRNIEPSEHKNFNLRRQIYNLKNKSKSYTTHVSKLIIVLMIILGSFIIQQYLDNKKLAFATNQIHSSSLEAVQQIYPELKSNTNLITKLVDKLAIFKKFESQQQEQLELISLMKQMILVVNATNNVNIMEFDYKKHSLSLHVVTDQQGVILKLVESFNNSPALNSKWKFLSVASTADLKGKIDAIKN